jgi:hypothetical protein
LALWAFFVLVVFVWVSLSWFGVGVEVGIVAEMKKVERLEEIVVAVVKLEVFVVAVAVVVGVAEVA